MSLDLKGQQAQRFRDALVAAFPAYSDLDQMVAFKLSENLAAIAGSGGLNSIAFELVKWARANGRLDELLAGALEMNSGNPDLTRFAYEVALTSTAAPTPKLEARILPGVPFGEVSLWRAQMAAAERCVCRIEVEVNGEWEGLGTGSLITSDLVLTNDHVVKDAQQRKMRAQFDFALDAGGNEMRGPAIALGNGPASDLTLDFAVLRLETPLADRGRIAPTAQRFQSKEPLFILQHPNAEALKLCVGSVDTTTPTKATYTTNTLPGSSGSPCFTIGWEMVVLHRGAQGSTNFGTRTSAILAHLKATGTSL